MCVSFSHSHQKEASRYLRAAFEMALKVLLVGGGITSAVTGTLLRRAAGNRVHLVLWDKARSVGGRMSTSKSRTNEHCTADLGAQYFTSTPDNFAKNRNIYESLMKEGLLEDIAIEQVEGRRNTWPEGTQNFVAPSGSSSIVSYFVEQSKLDEIAFEHHVSSVTTTPNGIEVETTTGKKKTFDVVILTMPVPQVLQLKGSLEDLINSKEEVRAGLHTVKYSSRYALGLYFGKTDVLNTEKWVAKYIDNHPIFRYVAIDHRKRNRPDSRAAVTLHTNVTFGAENVDKDIDDVKTLLLAEYTKLFPHWPKPEHVKCHKWRFSQVTMPYPGSPGFVVLHEGPHNLVLSGGDSFSSSGFDNCIASAQLVASYILKTLR